jgi:hypothetical protein
MALKFIIRESFLELVGHRLETGMNAVFGYFL